jgi:uncharacterized protein (TIGR02118 family)
MATPTRPSATGCPDSLTAQSPAATLRAMTVKLVVLYPATADQAAWDAHYLDVHSPIADTIPGLLRQDTAVVSTAIDGQELPFRRISELYFPDQETLMAAFGSPEGQATNADFQQIAPPGTRMLVAELD